MQVFTMPAEKFDEQNIDKQAIRHLILKHRSGIERLQKLETTMRQASDTERY